jgi:hypothetical protein
MMDKPKLDLSIDELAFSLFQRSLHPELFNIYAKRQIRTENYQADLWATGCSHVLTVQANDACLTEIISAPGQPLPKRGLVERFQFRGQKKHKCILSKGINYMTDFQVEKMTPNIYQKSQSDLKNFARNRGLYVKFPKLETSDLQPFTYIDFEARRNELHIHTFHGYPQQATIIKTQSLIGFRKK